VTVTQGERIGRKRQRVDRAEDPTIKAIAQRYTMTTGGSPLFDLIHRHHTAGFILSEVGLYAFDTIVMVRLPRNDTGPDPAQGRDLAGCVAGAYPIPLSAQPVSRQRLGSPSDDQSWRRASV